MPLSWAASRASAALFLLRNAAPEDAFAIRILARRAFWNACEIRKAQIVRSQVNLPFELSACLHAGFDDKFDWSLIQWQEQVERWQAHH